MTEKLLKVENLSVEFWVDGVWYPAAREISFELEAGRTLAIVGESGSGKSTTAMALTRLLPTNARVSGSVSLNGADVLEMTNRSIRKIRGHQVAYIFQEPMTALNPVYTIGFQIVETLRTHFDWNPTKARLRAIELLEMVELPNPEEAFDK